MNGRRRAGASAERSAELRLEERLHPLGTRLHRPLRARMTSAYSSCPAIARLDPIERDGRIELAQRPHDRDVERDVTRLRKAIRAVAGRASTAGRGNRTNGLCEVRVPHHQLSIFPNVASFVLVAGAEHRVASGRQLVHVHPAVQPGAGVADHAPCTCDRTRARAEQDKPEVSSRSEMVDNICERRSPSIARRYLLTRPRTPRRGSPRIAPLEMLAQLRNTRAKIRSCASSSNEATSTTYTVLSLEASRRADRSRPLSFTSPAHRVEMFRGDCAPCGSSHVVRAPVLAPERSSMRAEIAKERLALREGTPRAAWTAALQWNSRPITRSGEVE